MATSKHISATERFTDDGFKPVGSLVDGALAIAGTTLDQPRAQQIEALRTAIDEELIQPTAVDALIEEGYVELLTGGG